MYDQLYLITYLHLFLASYKSITCCRMDFSQFFRENQIERIKSLLPMLKQLQPLKVTEGANDDELTPEGAMSINYAATAHTLYGFLLKASTRQSPAEMLESITKDLSSATPEAAIPAMESLTNAE